MCCQETRLKSRSLSVLSRSRRIGMLLCLVLFVATVPAVAGMPSRGGATHTLVNPPAAKALPLPVRMNELWAIDAPTLLDNCVKEPPLAGEALPLGTMLCSDVVDRGGVDHQVAATTGRLKQRSTLVVGSVPSGSVLVAAWLYWSLLRDPAMASLGESLVFDGHELQGVQIGSAQQPCWDATTEVVGYRAPVTEFLSSAINGEYTLSGIPIAAGVTPGINPWDSEGDVPPYFEGAAIVVVYLNREVPASSIVVIHDNVLSLQDELTVQHSLSMVVPAPVEKRVRFSRIAADGQTSLDAEATVSLNTWLGKTSPVLVRGSKSDYDRGSDFSGGRSNRELMDAESSFIPMTNDLLTIVGGTQYVVRYDLDLDFLTPPCSQAAPPEAVEKVFKLVPSPPPPVLELVDCISVLAHVLTIR